MVHQGSKAFGIWFRTRWVARISMPEKKWGRSWAIRGPAADFRRAGGGSAAFTHEFVGKPHSSQFHGYPLFGVRRRGVRPIEVPAPTVPRAPPAARRRRIRLCAHPPPANGALCVRIGPPRAGGGCSSVCVH